MIDVLEIVLIFFSVFIVSFASLIYFKILTFKG